jgi:WD40 repeat protein
LTQAHEGEAKAVAFSPDGARLVTVGQDSRARIWNVRAGPPIELRRARTGENARVESLAFSPNDAWLVSGSTDGAARVWNMRDLSAPPVSLLHEEARVAPRFYWADPFGTPPPVAPDVAFTPVWPFSLLRRIVVSFSADSSRLATATFEAVRLWNMRELESAPAFYRNEAIQPILSLPDAAALASMTIGSSVALSSVSARAPVLSHVLSEPPSVKQWDLRSGTSRQIRADLVVFSGDLSLLASSGANSIVQVWNLHRRDLPPLQLTVRTNQGATSVGRVNAIAFSHDNALLAAADGLAVRVWDLRKPDAPPLEYRVDLPVAGSLGRFVVFSRDSTRLIVGGTGARDVLLWDLLEPDTRPLVFNSPVGVWSAALSRDGNYLALGSDDGDVWLRRLWSGAADALCARITRNLSLQEWRYFVGSSPYERTCPGLPAGTGAAGGSGSK